MVGSFDDDFVVVKSWYLSIYGFYRVIYFWKFIEFCGYGWKFVYCYVDVLIVLVIIMYCENFVFSFMFKV